MLIGTVTCEFILDFLEWSDLIYRKSEDEIVLFLEFYDDSIT